MARRKEVHEWLKDDPKQLAWAKEYLRKKGVNLVNVEGHAWLMRIINALDAETRRSMRAAWNQQASKENGKRKTRSFTLSDEASRALKQTAQQQHCSQVQVIERLLTDLSQFKKDVQQQVKEKKPAQSIDRLTKSHLEKNRALQCILQEWQAQADALLSVGARYRIALKAAGLLDKNLEPSLNPDQKATAARLQAHWKDVLEKEIKAKTRLAQFLAGDADRPADK